MGDTEVMIGDILTSTTPLDDVNKLIAEKNAEIQRLTEKVEELKIDVRNEQREKWAAREEKGKLIDRVKATAEMLKVMSAGLRDEL